MPDVFLYLSQTAERDLARHKEELGKSLCQATISALPGRMELADVAVRFIAHTYENNATTLQIVGMASHTDEREEHLLEWAIALAEVWQDFADKHSIIWKDDVDVWPTMPVGKWMMATRLAIATAKKALGD